MIGSFYQVDVFIIFLRLYQFKVKSLLQATTVILLDFRGIFDSSGDIVEPIDCLG